MQTRLLAGIAIFLCIFAILADFTSKLMSITVDGVTLAIVIWIVVRMAKGKDQET